MSTTSNNVALLYPDYVQPTTSYTPTFSGGSWSATLPLTNLQSTQLSKVARSANLSGASLVCVVDLKTIRNIEMIAIGKHNGTSSATVKIELSNDNFSTVIHTSNYNVIYPSGKTTEDMQGYNVSWYYRCNRISARYVKLTFADPNNAAGYFEFSRLLIGECFQPEFNMEYGSTTTGWQHNTDVTKSLGGSDFFNRKAPRRKQTFTINYSGESEAFDKVFEMQRKLGIDGQTFFVFEPVNADYVNKYPMTFTRSTTAWSPSTGFPIDSNIPRYEPGKLGKGIFIEEDTTNSFLNSTGTSAVTQTIAVTTSNGGKWTCSVEGSGSVTSSASGATATGYGTATAGNPNTITVTGNGNVTYTVTGADTTTKIQVENKAYKTSMVTSASYANTRNAEVLTVNPAGFFNMSLTQGSVSAWVYITGLWRDSTSTVNLFGTVSSGVLNLVTISKTTNTIIATISNNAGASSTTGAVLGSSLSEGWHLITATWDSSAFTLYVDGVASTPLASPKCPSVSGSTAYIGNNYNNTSKCNTIIDDFRTYNRALSAAEVQAIYNSQSTPYPPDSTCTCYLPFDGIHDFRQQQRSFLGTLEDLSPIDYPYFDRHTIPMQIKEVI